MIRKDSVRTVITDSEFALEVESLFKKYNKKSDYAVQDITFSCKKGKIIGLLGANGAGKSTTLKCITGMIPFSQGSIRICGADVTKYPLIAKRNFSFVTDNHAVFNKMTGNRYLSFMADVFGVPDDLRRERCFALEKVFRLGDSVNNLISSYSHGMKQKVCMMGSLMHYPDLWILDEPMVGLDPRTQNSVTSFMKDYVKGNRSILFSSHNLDVVRRICDRVIIIAEGRIVADMEITDEARADASILESYYIGEDSDGEKKC